MGATPAFEQEILELVRDNAWLGLHKGAPTAGNEVTGRDYSRAFISLDLPTGGDPSSSTSDALVEWQAGQDWGLVSHLAFWDAPVGGEIWIPGGALATPRDMTSGSYLRLKVGAIVVEAD